MAFELEKEDDLISKMRRRAIGEQGKGQMDTSGNIFTEFQKDEAPKEPLRTPDKIVGGSLINSGQSLGQESPAGGALVQGLGAGLAGGPVTGGIVAGTSLVAGLMANRAKRKRQEVKNEIDRRKRLSDSIQAGSVGEQNALKTIIDGLRGALT